MKTPMVYVVQIQYDPTLDYGCGVDMTTRDTLHIDNSGAVGFSNCSMNPQRIMGHR